MTDSTGQRGTLLKIDRETLICAFQEAKAAALAADPGPEADGGTCNFDTPAIRLPRVRERFVQECAAEAGIEASPFDWLGGRRRTLVMLDLFAFAALLVITGFLTTETQLWIVAPLLGAAAFAYSPLQNAMVAEAAGGPTGSAAGFSNAIGSIGTTIVPLAVGAAFQATQSYEVAFAVLAIGPFLGALAMLPARDPSARPSASAGGSQDGAASP